MLKIKLTSEKQKELLECLNEMFEAIPKSRRYDYLGNLNELSLFLEGRNE